MITRAIDRYFVRSLAAELLVAAIVVLARLDAGRFREWRFLLELGGALLNAVGLLVALAGVAQLGRDLFDREPPLYAALRRIGARLRHPFRKTVFGSGSVVVGALAAHAKGQVLEPAVDARPPADAGPEVWHEYLVSRLEEVGARIDDEARSRTMLRDDLVERIGELERRLEASLEAQHLKVKRALGGANGEGVRTAWWGLALTLLGSVMQAVASLT